MITGTPIPSETPYPYDTSLNVISPVQCRLFGEDLLRRKRAVAVRQNTKAYIQMQMLDPAGIAVPLEPYGIAASGSSLSTSAHVEVRFREATLMGREVYSATAEVLDATTGLILVTIPDEVIAAAGIYLAEAGVVDADDALIFSNELYVYNEGGAWRTDLSRNGPPTIDDFRLSLRDSDPLENELIGELDYGLVEIAYAAVRTVTFWNESQPPVRAANSNTISFPFRDLWVTGGHCFLFELAAEHYRRNFLAHSSGGVATDDRNRWQQYEMAFKGRYDRFKETVLQNKVQINYANGWGGIGSGYNRMRAGRA